jgi:sugar phosphate permease
MAFKKTSNQENAITAQSVQKAVRYRWLIFALLAMGYILVYFHRLCPAVLAVDLMRDLNAGGSLTGLLSGAYFYMYALMQLPAGLLSDSWGPRKTITFFFIVACVGSVVLGLAPTVIWAVIGRALVGVGVAMLFVPTLKILAEWFRIQEFAFMTGILMAMGGIGALTAATPLVWLSNWIGWRNAFVLVGVFTLVLAIAVWIVVRNRPSEMGWEIPGLITPISSQPEIGLLASVKQVLSCKYFWPLAVWFFFNFGLFFSLGGLWGGPYLMHVYGMQKSESGRILSMLAVGLVVGGPFLSWLSDKVFKRRKPVLVLSATGVAALTAMPTFFTDAIPVWGLHLLFLLLALFGNGIVAVTFTMNKELFPVSIAGTATGLVNLFCFAGAAAFQPILGYILEQYDKKGAVFSLAGYQAVFRTLMVCALVALFCAFLTRETLQRRTGTDRGIASKK